MKYPTARRKCDDKTTLNFNYCDISSTPLLIKPKHPRVCRVKCPHFNNSESGCFVTIQAKNVDIQHSDMMSTREAGWTSVPWMNHIGVKMAL
jgi:hypothetical protein